MATHSSAAFRTPIRFEDLDLSPFAALPAAARSKELFFVDQLVEAVVDSACLRTVAAMGLAPGDPDAIAAEAGIAEDRHYAWQWLLARLQQSELLERDTGGRITAVHEARWTQDALDEAIAQTADHTGSTFELIAQTAARYPEFLRGEIDAAEVLRGPHTRLLWEPYFHQDNLAYAPINEITAAAVTAARPTGALRILEVGGGLGSAAFSLLGQCADRVTAYCFTEIEPWFLAKGRAALRARFPDLALTAARVDLNRPLDQQGVTETYDLVLGVNVLHTVHDLLQTLRALRACLAPDGLLALGEAVRPTPDHLVPMEFVFQLTREFRDIVVDPAFRPRGGFLHTQQWTTALQRAGFGAPRLVPDPDRARAVYPTYSLAAILAEP